MANTAGIVKLAFTLAASVGVALALAYASYSYQPSGTILSTWKHCNWPNLQKGSSSNSAGNIIDSSLCVVLPLFKQARSDLHSVGLFSLALSGIMPLVAHSTYVAISPNSRISFISGALPALAALAVFIGGGVVAAGPYVIFYTLGSLLYLSKRASLAPLPTRAIGVHLLNVILFLYVGAGFCIMLLEPTGGRWYKAVIALVLVPLALLNLPTISGGSRVPNNEVDVRKGLTAYSAGDLSSAFERTWSSYRRVGLASAIFYWYGIGRVANALYLERPVKLNDVSFNSLLTFIGTSTALLALVTIERLTFRAQASTLELKALNLDTKMVVSQVTQQTPIPHPLTGAQPSKVDLECEKAVARAPAGHPIAEVGLKGTAFALLLGGPGLAACFWWARGEEEAGWKSRKEWREIQALSSKKQ
ncbi:unnamed protein product [Tilletia controversa]|uniref:Uncharacterized protein n=1 Tax=Tilletia controversa TaxID=13291 RepID=A0A8X7MRM9_9BASI|nr:hypothetical protein CF328_g4296 [Tilletia controversa]KAE8246765.1 hypothetical protein A4X06_0g4886 [Tilletia controversa]CAD6937329.1 unnamed protein product [Tilletia controversa]CAD6943548.1 unnamed protein product [Tilletia controversa]CAD6947096.1 unnamed protein product [Tilletia controversa]